MEMHPNGKGKGSVTMQQPLLSGECAPATDGANAFYQSHGFMMEESKAYVALRRAGLISSEFRKRGIEDLDLIQPNSSKGGNFTARMLAYATVVGFCTYDATHLEFMVPAGHVQKICDGNGNYFFAAPGYHNIVSMFYTKVHHPVPLRGHVKHGDRSILVVDQGFIGYATDNGMPVLLPPGIHEWKSDTMDFVKYIDLEDHLIALGPYTLLTVDEGYAAVTQDNGQQVILGGGQVHLLNHRNWKFEKFMTLKVQTDELERIQATSADNILMEVTSTLNWRIVDVQMAAVMAAETMASSGRARDVAADITKVRDTRPPPRHPRIRRLCEAPSGGERARGGAAPSLPARRRPDVRPKPTQLRHDVLKQAIASLAAFIGSVNYSDSFHLAAAAQASQSTKPGVPVAEEGGPRPSAPPAAIGASGVDNPMFDIARMNSAVETANTITSLYGVEVISINIISAKPKVRRRRRAARRRRHGSIGPRLTSAPPRPIHAHNRTRSSRARSRPARSRAPRRCSPRRPRAATPRRSSFRRRRTPARCASTRRPPRARPSSGRARTPRRRRSKRRPPRRPRTSSARTSSPPSSRRWTARAPSSRTTPRSSWRPSRSS